MLLTVCFLLIVLCCFTPLHQVDAAEKTPVNIAFYNNDVFYTVDQNNQLTGGYAYNLQTALNRYLNWDVTYDYGLWYDCLDRVKTGKSDLVFGAFKTPDREANYAFNQIPIANIINYVCARADEDYLEDDYTKLANKKIGLVKGDAISQEFEDFLTEQQISVNYVEAGSTNALRSLLADGTIDYFINSSMLINTDEKAVQTFSVVPLYIMGTKNQQALLDEFDAAIEKMKTTNPPLMAELLSKVYSTEAINMSNLFDTDTRRFISTAQPLKCGVISDAFPYYYTSRNLEVQGIIPSLIKHITQTSGLNIKLVPFNSMEDALTALEKGDIEMLGMVSNDYYKAQNHQLTLSVPYMTSPTSILKGKSTAPSDEIENIYAIVDTPFGHENILKSDLKEITFKKYDTPQACIDALNNQEVGGAIIENLNALNNEGALKNTDNLISYTANDLYLKHCFAISNTLDVRYVEILDRVIGNLDTTDINLSAINDVSTPYPSSFMILFLNRYKVQLILALIIILITAFFLYYEISSAEKEKLRLGDERFKIAVKQAQVSYFEYDVQTKALLVFNETFAKRHHFLVNQPQKYLLDEDAVNLSTSGKAKLKEAFYTLTHGTNDASIKLKVSGEDQTFYFYIVKLTAIRNKDESLLKILGSVLDITTEQNTLYRYQQEISRSKIIDSLVITTLMVNLSQDKIESNSEYDLFEENGLKGEKYSTFFEKALTLINEEAHIELCRKHVSRGALLNTYVKGHRDIRLSVRIKRQDQLLWIEINAHLIEDPFSGDIICVILPRLAREREALQSALDAANHANTAKSNFLSSISHEIRTPMNAIMGITDIALENPKIQEDPTLYEQLTDIKASSDYLLSIINNMLDISRIESGETTLNKSLLNMDAFIQQIYALISARTKKQKIEFIFKTTPELCKTYIGDADKLQKILINILDNAIKFTPENGQVFFDTHIISKTDHRTMVRFTIRDSGIGMDEAFLKDIFNPFSREKMSEISYIGTGLGMAISKNFANLMGGDIQITSALGKGTTVMVTVPLENNTPVVSNPQIALPKPKDPIKKRPIKDPQFVGKNVLLVEDNALNTLIAKNFLEKMGFTVETAQNGQEAVEQFKSKKAHYYFAILMDIRMPVMNGLDATKAIRQLDQEDSKSIVIIAMTANAFDFDREKSLDAGMNEHLTKPIVINVLADLLKKYC